jgi:hypothetical protein
MRLILKKDCHGLALAPPLPFLGLASSYYTRLLRDSLEHVALRAPTDLRRLDRALAVYTFSCVFAGERS